MVDRLADEKTRNTQHLRFLSRADELTHARETLAANDQGLLQTFVHDFTSVHPIEQLAFSSSLSGNWIFGSLSRDENPPREVWQCALSATESMSATIPPITTNDIFRAELEKATGARKAQSQQHLDDLTVRFYRDPKRQNASAINYNGVTCAQCHQTSARDGVHMAFNDGLNKDVKKSIGVSEFFFHDADEQLKLGMKYWARMLEEYS